MKNKHKLNSYLALTFVGLQKSKHPFLVPACHAYLQWSRLFRDCAKPGEQAITNKRIEEIFTPAVMPAADKLVRPTYARLNLPAGRQQRWCND